MRPSPMHAYIGNVSAPMTFHHSLMTVSEFETLCISMFLEVKDVIGAPYRAETNRLN